MNRQVVSIGKCNIIFAFIEYALVATMDCTTGCLVPDKIVCLLKCILGLRIIYNLMLIVFNSNQEK